MSSLDVMRASRRTWLALGVGLVSAVGLVNACDGPTVKLPPGTLTDAGLAQIRWTHVDAPQVDWFAVHGSSATDVILVGGEGSIARWNGVKLSPESSGLGAGVELHGVFAVSPTLAYAVGGEAMPATDLGPPSSASVILQWNGSTWTRMNVPVNAFLTAVYATDKEAFAVGEAGTALRFDGTAWKAVLTDSPDNLLCITVDGSTPVAVGTLGTVARWDGSARFARSAIAGYAKTLAGCTHGGPLHFAGLDGAVFRYSGGATPVTGAPKVFLRGIAATGNALFVVGWDGVVERLAPAPQLLWPDIPRGWRVDGIYAAAPDDVWVVGALGLVLHGPPPMDPPADTDGGASGDGGKT